MAAKKKKKRSANHVISKTKKRPVKKAAPKKRGRKKKAAPKKKRNRSDAAKRSWVTRREKKAQAQRAIKRAIRRQHRRLPGFSKAVDVAIAQLKEREADVTRREKDVERLRANLTRYIDSGALEADNQKLFTKVEKSFVETDESKMLARLRVAEYAGDFDDEAGRLAEEYDWDIREVYTLFMSPKEV
jgi:hypothetical protein